MSAVLPITLGCFATMLCLYNLTLLSEQHRRLRVILWTRLNHCKKRIATSGSWMRRPRNPFQTVTASVPGSFARRTIDLLPSRQCSHEFTCPIQGRLHLLSRLRHTSDDFTTCF